MQTPSKQPQRRKARITMEQTHAIRSVVMGLMYAAAALFIAYVPQALAFVKGYSRIALIAVLALYGIFRLYRGITAMNELKKRIK
jgi:hypothetical protein